jgi:hypothetical protein
MRGGAVDQFRDPTEPVEETELRVDVEVREVVRGDGHGTTTGVRGRGTVQG